MQPLWKNNVMLSQKLKIELRYNPSIPLLHIYPMEKNCLYWKGTNIPMFIAPLFIRPKIWKPPKCSSMDTDSLVYMPNGNYSVIKKEGNPIICKNTDVLWRHHVKWNKSEKDTYGMISHTVCVKTGKEKKHLMKHPQYSINRAWKIIICSKTAANKINSTYIHYLVVEKAKCKTVWNHLCKILKIMFLVLFPLDPNVRKY